MILQYAESYEEVLSQIDEASIARLYLSMEPHKAYKSLFRKDKHPSARLYYNRNGRLQYNDFVYHYSVPYAIMQLNGWSMRDFLIRVTKDFNLVPRGRDLEGKFKKNVVPNIPMSIDDIKRGTIIERKFRSFAKHDKEFWGMYGITQEWLQHPAVKVNPISHFWIDNHNGRTLIKAEKYAYCFDYFEYNGRFLRKIYQPYVLKKSFKWLSNVVSGEGGVCQLWETLPKDGRDLLIVTSSLKDGGCIYCNTFDIFSRNEGIYAIAPNNENGYLPDQIINKLNTRFKRIVTWFDNDESGINAGIKYFNKYGWEPVYNPLGYPKDPSDFRKQYGHSEFITLFKHLIYDT